MKIYEVMQRDPRVSSLANEGQARIRNEDDQRAQKELRAELETFVCDGQYGRAIEGILASFLTQLNQPRQHAAWVSGFYGSGKSHLLKMLGHLWVNTEFADGSKARTLVPQLPENVQAHLRELDNQSHRVGKAAFAVAGTLPASSSEHVRSSVLSIILRASGYPVLYPQARFCFWLQDNRWYERVKTVVESAGKDWLAELDRLYVSPLIAQAVLACDPNFAPSEAEARKTIREQFPNLNSDISTQEFISAMRRALSSDYHLPLSVLILDETQQYIGHSDERSTTFTELSEAVQTQTDSRVMLVASGQAALSDTPLLQKLRGRFRITYQLSDTDVEAVTRKVLLRKKSSKEDTVRQVLSANAGEISKHLNGTRLAERTADADTIVQDYPLLPTRRRFWEECFRAVDAAGTSSQLRSQLRIMDDSLKKIAEKALGALIPADTLFDALASDLISTGVLLNETYYKIQAADDGTPDGILKKRISGLVFLIGKLPREAGVDTGIRATSSTLADLLIEDLAADSGPFRRRIEGLLQSMASSGMLMLVNDEYRMQTTEGTEWERAFREKTTVLQQREADILVKREQYFVQAVQGAINQVTFAQGSPRVVRKLSLYREGDTIDSTSEKIPVLLRDGWTMSRNDTDAAARSAGQDSPYIYIFIPRNYADALRALIVQEEAANQVIAQKGTPGTPEGMEARTSMQSRLLSAQTSRERLINEIVGSAAVIQGGGNEIPGVSLISKIQEAVTASASRLFPRFTDADYPNWNQVLSRAKQGQDNAFSLIGWQRPLEDHPVTIEVTRSAGRTPRGGEIGKTLRAAPYGWPQDAIDAALVALVGAGVLSASQNGAALSLSQLDQTKIRVSDFRQVRFRLNASEKLALRGLFTTVGVPARPNEEESSARFFLQQMEQFARNAGGDAPLPELPDMELISSIRRLTGTEQLKALLDNKSVLETSFNSWKNAGALAEERLCNWNMLQRMLMHLGDEDGSTPIREEVQAIKARRSLLEGENPVPPLRAVASQILRASLTQTQNRLKAAWQHEMTYLCAQSIWNRLEPSRQEEIFDSVGLMEPTQVAMSEDEELLRSLDVKPLATRALEIAAIPRLFNNALQMAAEEKEIPLSVVTIRPAILNSEEEVREWLAEHENLLMGAIRNGRVSVR